MILIYIHSLALHDEIFLQEFSNTFKNLKEKTLILHGFHENESKESIWFQTKRLSAHLSEMMITNNAFSGEMRDLIKLNNNEVVFDSKKINKLFEIVQVVILNSVVKVNDKLEKINIENVVKSSTQFWDFSQKLVFTQNPLSPLGNSIYKIENEQDKEAILKVYPEESETINLAYDLKPSFICSSKNYINFK